MIDQNGRSPPACPSGRRRLYLLIACITGGVAIGVVGNAITGNDWWYLAVPVAIAIPWLFLADPERCLRHPPHD